MFTVSVVVRSFAVSVGSSCRQEFAESLIQVNNELL